MMRRRRTGLCLAWDRISVSKYQGTVVNWVTSYATSGGAGYGSSTPYVDQGPFVTFVQTAPKKKLRDFAWDEVTV